MNKTAKLKKISGVIANCSRCKQTSSGKPVAGEGSADADIMFIGEAPGKEEAKTGRPFVGRSGQLLRQMIRNAGLSEKEVYITSPVKYLPDKVTPGKKDILHGRKHLKDQIAVIDPKIIVLLGSVAYQSIFEEKIQITRYHGKTITVDGRIYMITFHPAAALRSQKKVKSMMEKDFIVLKLLLTRLIQREVKITDSI